MKSRWEAGINTHEARCFVWWGGSGSGGSDGGVGGKGNIFFLKTIFVSDGVACGVFRGEFWTGGR